MWLTKQVLEHGINSASVGGVPEGGRPQQDQWIRVVKKGERRGRQGEIDRERERERELQGIGLSSFSLFFGLVTPCSQGGVPLAESSGSG